MALVGIQTHAGVVNNPDRWIQGQLLSHRVTATPNIWAIRTLTKLWLPRSLWLLSRITSLSDIQECGAYKAAFWWDEPWIAAEECDLN